MIPRWMLVERMVAELGALRRSPGVGGAAAAAVAQAAESVEALNAASDEEAFRQAWGALERANAALARVERLRGASAGRAEDGSTAP